MGAWVIPQSSVTMRILHTYAPSRQVCIQQACPDMHAVKAAGPLLNCLFV